MKQGSAEKIMSLVLDQEVFSVSQIKDKERLGALVFQSNLRKHFSKHIQSFYGKTMFDSSDGIEKIKAILGKKMIFYMRRFDNESEKIGATKIYKHIQKEFNNLTKQEG